MGRDVAKPSNSALFHCYSPHLNTLLLLCRARPCLAILLLLPGPAQHLIAAPSQFVTVPCYTVAFLNDSRPFRCKAKQRLSIALRFVALLRFAVALLNDSRPCQSIAALCHADAPNSFAFPLRHISMRCYSAALLGLIPDKPALAGLSSAMVDAV